jgi:thioredoxin reductase
MEKFDVVVAGGGSAGLSAALVLGRALRTTLVCGAGKPRNAPSRESHNLFSRDGINPLELIRIGREQLEPYPSVQFREEHIVGATKSGDGFDVTLQNGSTVWARRLILATGMIDELPPIEGVNEIWGSSASHCPYCHGFEVRDQPIVVHGNGGVGFILCAMIKGWSSDVVLCTDGPSTLSEEQRQILQNQNISIREEKIARFESQDGILENVVFENGEKLARRALFMRAEQKQRSDLAQMLGCEIEGGIVTVDASSQTTVAGVYAAGDMITRQQQISHAVFSGTRAASIINHEWLMAQFQ